MPLLRTRTSNGSSPNEMLNGGHVRTGIDTQLPSPANSAVKEPTESQKKEDAAGTLQASIWVSE